MTAYGEIITPKEIPRSYSIVPGADDEPLVRAEECPGFEADPHILKFKNFCFRHYLLEEPGTSEYRITSGSDFLMMQFCLQGECVFLDAANKPLASFNAPEHNIIFFPAGEFGFSSSSGTLEVVNIYFEKEFLLKYIPDEHNFKNLSATSDVSLFFKGNLYLRHKITSVLQDIINCEFLGHLKKLYIQAKLIELLSLQLVQYEEEKNEASELKQADVERMMKVKELIRKNLGERLSLAMLAREAGTNEQYLKKHFKLLFGDTVFGYILSCKMEKAREMLLSGEYKISHIAELSGYKHATHFTTAFKKFYGYLPQQLKGKA